MAEANYVYRQTGGAPLKMWTRGVPVEDGARRQLDNVAGLPFIFKHVAVMPDVQYGKGATVGSVIPTKGAIIPAAVGVDIGCGMIAARTNLAANDLPDLAFCQWTPDGRAVLLRHLYSSTTVLDARSGGVVARIADQVFAADQL